MAIRRGLSADVDLVCVAGADDQSAVHAGPEALPGPRLVAACRRFAKYGDSRGTRGAGYLSSRRRTRQDQPFGRLEISLWLGAREPTLLYAPGVLFFSCDLLRSECGETKGGHGELSLSAPVVHRARRG